MSHLIETYAANSGSTIKKPKLLEKFYPLDFDKYITIQASSKFPSKCWDYFPELVEFLLPELNKQGIKIVQLGARDDQPVPGCVHLLGATSIAQTHYILARALLHIGNDSFAIHSCSALDVPLIGLYSISPPEVCGPYWKNDKQITIMADLQGQKPSYSPQESPKVVNRIKPEQVIAAVNQLLELSAKTVKSIHFGDNYNSPTIEFSPNCPFTLQIPPQQIIQIRLDYLNELTLINYQHALQLAAQRKVLIYADKPFNLDPFKQVRQNIAAIVYKLQESGHNPATSGQEDIEINFVKSLKRGGFQFRVVREHLSDKEYTPETLTPEQIAELKFKYLDVATIQFVEKKKIELDFVDNMMYISKRLIFSNNMIFRSKNSFKKGLTEKENQISIGNVETLKNLQEELDYLYIYQKL